MQSDGWRLKKRLTMAPVAPRRKARFVQAKVKRASLPLGDDDPMMERAFATEGGAAPLTTSSSDDEAKPKPTMARITPGAHDAPVQTEAAKEETKEEAAETKEEAEEKEEKEETKEEAAETKKAKALDLLAHEPPLASPRTPSYEEEPGYEEELSEEAKPTDHVYERVPVE